MRFWKFPVIMAVFASLTVPVQAQETEVPSDLPEIRAEDVTVGQIVSFVNALIASEQVRRVYMAKIEAAETEDEIQTLVAEADQQGMAAVDRVIGITVAEYMAISKAAQDSEDLQARINERIETLREEQKGTVTSKPAQAGDDEAAE